MSAWIGLDQELVTICNEFGWSYSGYQQEPVSLVRGLFRKVSNLDQALSDERRTRDIWVEELRAIVRQAVLIDPVVSDDPFKIVKRLVEESNQRARPSPAAAASEDEELEVQPMLRANFSKLSRAEVAAIGHAVIAELQSRCSES